MTSNDIALLRMHYETHWHSLAHVRGWTKGRRIGLPQDFAVLEFPPHGERPLWTYATSGMSQGSDQTRIELHLFAPAQDQSHVELLHAVAHYHRTGARLGLSHTVNFGRPWLPSSACTHGLISLPYLDGPALEWCSTPGGKIRCLWLVPITPPELQFKKAQGVEALEARFDALRFDYADPTRPSVV